MNDSLFSRDRLQPALLDRLIDDEPGMQTEPIDKKTISRSRLRQIVLRDLTWLFNATGGIGEVDDRTYAHAKHSVINFGMPSLSGKLVSKIEMFDLEQALRRAIIDFEPRILADSLTVTGKLPVDELSHHNIIEFEISAQLWAQPYPLELLLRTDLDLETGMVEVRDSKSSVSAVFSAKGA